MELFLSGRRERERQNLNSISGFFDMQTMSHVVGMKLAERLIVTEIQKERGKGKVRDETVASTATLCRIVGLQMQN